MKNKIINTIKDTNVNASFPYLIKVNYLGEIYNYVNSDTDVIYKGETYKGVYFEIQPPTKDSEGFSKASITIGTEQEWIAKIRNHKYDDDLITLTFVAIIQYGENIEPLEEMQFTLTNASWNLDTIKFDMEFDDLLSIVIPCHIITTQNTPAIG